VAACDQAKSVIQSPGRCTEKWLPCAAEASKSRTFAGCRAGNTRALTNLPRPSTI